MSHYQSVRGAAELVRRDSGTLIGPVEAPFLHVMSYNLRRRFTHYLPGTLDRWEEREPLITRLLQDERPALLGTQEAMHVQATAVSRALGPDYRRIGKGRNSDGRGEGCPTFYDATRLELRRWQQIALSPTPDVPGSRGWGNHVPRLAVVADFTDRATGRSLRHINTHLDHQSREARLEAIDLLRRVATSGPAAVIVTGDFNTGVDSDPHEAALEGGLLVDSWRTAAQRLTPEWGTYSAYHGPSRGRRIDWILVKPAVTVEATGINVRRFDGRAPSDHEALQAVVRW